MQTTYTKPPLYELRTSYFGGDKLLWTRESVDDAAWLIKKNLGLKPDAPVRIPDGRWVVLAWDDEGEGSIFYVTEVA